MAASSSKPRRLALVVDEKSGEVFQQRQRVSHVFDGKGYTLEGHGVEVPNFRLNLSGTEWDIIDWMKQHGGSANPVPLNPARLAPELCSGDTAVKKAIARLVRLNLLLRVGGARSGIYQLNPRRFWEGSGESHVKACLRMDPPPVVADDKARTAAIKAAEKALEAARTAAETAAEVAAALPSSKAADSARSTAQDALASAILAVDTARNLGAKLTAELRRFVQEQEATA
ncbi:hypothetical protein KYY02_31230 [Streptomyces pimonensis]|uniref:Uncharacterized protein n=1 Tax=Streptomyces pimonensis TaxID=2860288 RepID=A0ABV4J7R8_9ACTN